MYPRAEVLGQAGIHCIWDQEHDALSIAVSRSLLSQLDGLHSVSWVANA